MRPQKIQKSCPYYPDYKFLTNFFIALHTWLYSYIFRAHLNAQLYFRGTPKSIVMFSRHTSLYSNASVLHLNVESCSRDTLECISIIQQYTLECIFILQKYTLECIIAFTQYICVYSYAYFCNTLNLRFENEFEKNISFSIYP